MDQEKKNEAENLKEEASMTPVSPTLFTPPTLNLMEQILLAKIEKQNFHEDDRETDARLGGKKKNFFLRRTDSMDSQNSASTYNSFLSSDSASSGNLYCKCDDCLLGIVDDYQRSPSVIDRKKIPFKLIFVNEFDFQEVRGLADALPEREAMKLVNRKKKNDETKDLELGKEEN